VASYQTFVVRLPVELGRRARCIVGEGNPYEDLSELVAVSLENQLVLDAGEVDGAVQRSPEGEAGLRQAERADPSSSRLVPVALEGIGTVNPKLDGVPLDFLTNRLNPVPVAVRVLANLTLEGGPPTYGLFVHEACAAAREVGLRLEQQDRAQAVSQSQRRFTAWPVGPDEMKSAARFTAAFLLNPPGDEAQGPLAELGLAVRDGNLVKLTDRGCELAMAPNPLLGETSGRVLGAEQQQILASALVQAPGERAAAAAFVEAVSKSGGRQADVDRLMQKLHADWSENRVVSNRAAMLGRLRDLDLVTVDGRGPAATIRVAIHLHKLLEESESTEEGRRAS
jgi:hypothetical protein